MARARQGVSVSQGSEWIASQAIGYPGATWTTQPIRGILLFGFAGAESMHYTPSLVEKAYRFPDLRTLLARASRLRSADELAGLAAGSEEERAVVRRLAEDRAE